MSISIQPTSQPPRAAAADLPARAAAPQQGERQVEAPKPSAVKAPDPSEMREELRQAVERLNEQMRKQSRNLAFSVDEKADRTVIMVKNSNTGEVVRQIPNETVLRMAHSIEDLKGLLHNGKS